MSYKHEENRHNMLWFSINGILIDRQMNQSELARRAGVNRTVISSLKNGKIKKPSFDLACKLADALEVSLDDFREDRFDG